MFDAPKQLFLDTTAVEGLDGGVATGQARPNLPGIPLDDQQLPNAYNVAVQQLANGDVVALVSQWVKHLGSKDWTEDYYRIVQYKQTIG